ncbi:MAG TPA: M1 family aminopeptidase [Acidobacteriota bacterium]|nr:M1 family aminopeptidase [Acidobacteriota bacterium]
MTGISIRQSLRLASIAALAGGLAINAPSVSARTVLQLDEDNQALYDSLNRPAVDPNAFFAVRPGSAWETPLGTYHFASGTIAFFRPVGGRPTGCLFEGDGTLTYSPPTEIERGQLFRFCGDSTLQSECDRAYIRFFDSAAVDGLYQILDRPAEGRKPNDGTLKSCENQASDDLTIRLAAVAWQMLAVAGRPPGFLYVAPHLKDRQRLHFLLDETATEAITLWRRPPGAHNKGTIDLVCSYDHPRSPAEMMVRPDMLHGGFDIEDYVSDVAITQSARMSLDVRVRVTVRQPVLTDWSFYTASDLEIDSILVQGAAAQFIYDTDGGWLLVRAGDTYEKGDSVAIRFLYRGDRILYKLPWGDYSIHHTTRWLPRAAPRRRADYATTFRFPRQYDVVSVGTRVADTIIGDERIVRWQTVSPAAYISFNYGSFDRLIVPTEDGPRIEIYRNQTHRRGVFSGDIRKDVAADVGGAIRLFSEMFGPYPWDHLAATEIPGFHGQGFPQLLHLAWYSFETNRKGVTDAFRAHEVAHQWFGHIVGWETYHDQWLSEGFAEYAGAMYVQARYQGDEEFFNALEESRDRVLKRGGRLGWHEGPYAAPIWLGFRCGSRQSPGSYDHLVYSKGAYVLHMLRYMLFDFQTGSDARFRGMMHDFIGRYSGTDASTADFQAVAEEHFGGPMQWFFDQWVYGVQIPRFEYRWERGQTPEGRWVVRGQINQYDVHPTFRSYMPITFVLDEGRMTYQQEVTGATTVFETPPLLGKPREVIFNDYHTVLCREQVVAKP